MPRTGTAIAAGIHLNITADHHRQALLAIVFLPLSVDLCIRPELLNRLRIRLWGRESAAKFIYFLGKWAMIPQYSGK